MTYLQKMKLNRTELVEGIKERLGIDNCLFVKQPARAVGEHLRRNLRAQDHAVNATVAAIQAWEFSRGSAGAAPLVLALTGPTGAGKTESGNLLAEALFERHDRVGGRLQSQGLLLFRGEDFKDNVTRPLTRYHDEIKARLAAHLRRCSSRAVVVFDEVQKVIPGTLDVLMEAMSDRPVLTHFGRNGVQEKYDCSNVIFVLISDIGVDSIVRLLLEGGAARADVPQHRLRAAVKAALDAQWERLHFGKAISEVVPFLPFEPLNMEQIIGLKFAQLGDAHRGQFWRRLRGSPGLFRHLAGPKYIRYTKHSLPGAKPRLYSKYGARNVVNGGPLQLLKARLFRVLDLGRGTDGVLRAAEAGKDVDVVLHGATGELELSVCDGGGGDGGGGDGGDGGDERGDGSAGTADQQCASKWRGKLFENA
eukprot:g3091.t1